MCFSHTYDLKIERDVSTAIQSTNKILTYCLLISISSEPIELCIENAAGIRLD